MADKSTQLVLDALSRAATDPAGMPLFQQKSAPGLFAGTAPGRKAAQRCKEEDLLRVIRTEPRGKAVREVVTITPKGLDHLLSQNSPRQVLHDLVRAVEGREKQLTSIIASALHAQTSLEAMKSLAVATLHQIEKPRHSPVNSVANGAVDCTATIMNCLESWAASTTTEDCPLPHLYRQLKGQTIGQFHDTLRRLYAERRIYLHPWTGPLCDLPEPPMALMVGHEIAYYASSRE